jgi:hypothetical protein
LLESPWRLEIYKRYNKDHVEKKSFTNHLLGDKILKHNLERGKNHFILE